MLLLVGGAARRQNALVLDASGAAARPRANFIVFAGSGTAAALTVACCISIYSVIDGAAVRIAPPIPYTVAVIGASALLMTHVVLTRYGRPAVVAEWRVNWPRIALVGILTLVTYALVLQAYVLGRVSYAGAVREISVVFAALVGWRWLGEGFGGWRVADFRRDSGDRARGMIGAAESGITG